MKRKPIVATYVHVDEFAGFGFHFIQMFDKDVFAVKRVRPFLSIFFFIFSFHVCQQYKVEYRQMPPPAFFSFALFTWLPTSILTDE